MARSRQARSVETRSRLLDAAAEIIARSGIDGASVDAIAELAERTSGSLYGQFGSKDALVVELLDESKDTVAARMAEDIAAADGLDARLAALWRNFVEPPEAARDWIRLEHELWVWATRPGNEPARDRLGQRYRNEYSLLGEALAEWADEGLIDPPLDARRMGPIVLAALLGLEMTHRLEPGAVDQATAVASLKALLTTRGT